MKRSVGMGYTKGFALPTVMIASIAMLIVLLSGLVASSSVNASLRAQYNDKLAEQAADAGLTFAEACLRASNYTVTWTSPLKPNTDCTGTAVGAACTFSSTLQPHCGVVESQAVRTTFSVPVPSGSATDKLIEVNGTTNLLRASTRSVASTSTTRKHESITFKNNPSASRPTQRFWYFGDRAGFDFGTAGTSAAVVPAACSVAPCRAGEGSTAISSGSGQLQFWTDGRTIWDRSGTAMPNGGGLLANGSTTQAAAVFPAGFDESKYIVVSNNTENGANNAGELYYSVVDMRLRAGLGDVTSKNIPVWSGVNDYASESTTAAPKSNGKGYWIITNSPVTTHMRVFSYNSETSQVDGVQTFNGPSGISQYGPLAGYSGFGTLNFNSDYSKLVLMAGDHCLGSCADRMGLVRLMNFNTATGAITNLNAWNNYTNNVGYSADFSPSGDYIYTTTIYSAYLARYKIAGNTTDAAIKASEEPIGVVQPNPISSCTGGGQVRLAPNGKMYVANCGTSYLSVINSPDAAIGSIGFIYNGVTLSSGTQSSYGLPQTVTVYTPYMTRY